MSDKMKTDRELLELAAKAAGIYVANDEFGNPTDLFCDAPNASAYEWNPLTDDGDALRLAVKLALDVYPRETHTDTVDVFTTADCFCNGRIISMSVPHDDDPYAATRRAITRAAAAIGEGMR